MSDIIIPHVNSPYKTSIDEQLLFYNITRCYSDGEYCHSFAIAAGDIIKYQGGHIMRNADARTVRSRQETFNSNGGHDAMADMTHDFATLNSNNFVVYGQKHKVWVLVFLVRTRGTR